MAKESTFTSEEARQIVAWNLLLRHERSIVDRRLMVNFFFFSATAEIAVLSASENFTLLSYYLCSAVASLSL